MAAKETSALKIAFSSDDLPAELSDRARFKLWHDIHNASIGSLEYAVSENRPFYARMEAMTVGQIALGTMACSIERAERGPRNIAENDVGGHNLFVNTGTGLIGGTQVGREFILRPGEAVLMSSSAPLQLFGGEENAWMTIILPDQTLNQTFVHADDYVARAVTADNQALSLLRRYDRFLNDSEPWTSPDLSVHAAETIIDLVGLALGIAASGGDRVEARGLQAARLAAITDKIAQRFSEPDFSVQLVAQELRLSVRYVHRLLQESGSSFAERVMALRLEKSRLMLTDRRNYHMRVSEIALHCGFNDISYFNRCFRRRFGCTPTAAR